MEAGISKIAVKKGEIIFLEGTPGDCAYLIESGSVEISVRRGGKTVSLGTRSKGEVVGEMAIIDSEPRSATAVACEESELFMISSDQLQKRLENANPILKMSLRMILDRFRETLSAVNHLQENGEEKALLNNIGEWMGESTYTAALREIHLEREMENGLGEGEFVPFFQPIVSLRDRKIYGFETLIRWLHPVKGLVPPSDFLPTAESCGMITRFTETMFQQSLRFLRKLHRQMADQRREGLPTISINLSGHDLVNEEFGDQLLARTREAGIAPGYVILEITETMLLADPDAVIDNLQRLRNAGFHVSLDDFGTGYSSLSYLHRFPVDALKIDRSFVRNMGENSTNANIITSIIMLAKQLGLKVVAEGIEEEAQYHRLHELGCDCGQGYLFSRPLPREEAIKLLI